MASKRVFLSTNEVAEMLGISPFTIRRYIQLRKLKAVKLEGSYRVRRADLELFLKAREIETEEELVAHAAADADARKVLPRRSVPTAQIARRPRTIDRKSRRVSTRVQARKLPRKPAPRDRKEQ